MFKSVVNLVASIVLLGCVVIGAAIYMGRGVPKGSSPPAETQAAEAPAPDAAAPGLGEMLKEGVDHITQLGKKELKRQIEKAVADDKGEAKTEPGKTPTETAEGDEQAKQPDNKATADKTEKALAEPEGATYVVAEGDTLYRIARETLGSGDRWPEIAKANGIDDPNWIRVGQKLRIAGAKP